ncbi:MAG: HlyC/CorC family transporter [Fimbriimonadia bacterium]
MSSIAAELSIIGVLILLNGIFAMSELALVAARKSRLRARAEMGDRSALAALRLSEQPERFLSTVQVGITLVGVLAGAFAGATVAGKLAEYFRGMDWLHGRADAVAIAIVVVIITYFSLIFGELVPKQIALRAPEGVAKAVAGPMLLISWLSAPLVWLLSVSSRGVLAVLRLRPTDTHLVTEEDVRLALQEGAESGALQPIESEILQRAARLDETKAARLMTRRPDIVWLDALAAWDINDKKIADTPHSFFPVCEGSLDKTIGIVGIRDLYGARVRGEHPDLRAMADEALYVPENITVLRLLENFRGSRAGLALVLDEFGSVEGLITLNDILEAMVGELPSVTDPSDWFQQREDGSWLVDGLMPLEEFSERVGLDRQALGEKDLQTLGGLARRALAGAPSTGAHFEVAGLRIEVVDMDGVRVDKLLVTRLPDGTTPLD